MPSAFSSFVPGFFAALRSGGLLLFIGPVQAQLANLPIVSIQASNNAAEEGALPGTFLVSRTGPLDLPLEVEYEMGGSASNGLDYLRLPGRVTLRAGQASAPIVVVPIDDRLQETDETIALTLAPRNRPFTLVVLPDSQYYTSGYSGGQPDMFTAQTRWTVDHRDALNIVFLLHEGDVTDNNTLPEWQRAKASLDLLEGIVPYSIAPGNHDGLNGSGNATALLNQFFPASNYVGRADFGGVFEPDRMDNSYRLFSAGGLDWLLLELEFGPRNGVLDWANQILSLYPERQAILLTHAHVYIDNTLHGSATNHLWLPTSYGRQNNGVQVWEKLLRRHPTAALAFNGHNLFDGTGRIVMTNDFGGRVYQMLANYQMNAYGGGGFLRVVQFFPAEDRMSVRTYSPYLDVWLQDTNNQFEYANLGLFTNTSPGYLIEPTQPTDPANRQPDHHQPRCQLPPSPGPGPHLLRPAAPVPVDLRYAFGCRLGGDPDELFPGGNGALYFRPTVA